MNNPPLTPADFTEEEKRMPALVNNDLDNFFSGTFTESLRYYQVAYRNSGDAQNARDDPGVVTSGLFGNFVPPNYEAFQTTKKMDFGGIQNYHEPEFLAFGSYTLFVEVLVERWLSADIRDSISPIDLPTDSNLTTEPYYWDFVVIIKPTITWKDVFYVDVDVDGTGLMSLENPGPGGVPGNLSVDADTNEISESTGGDAFAALLIDNVTGEVNWDGSAYTMGDPSSRLPAETAPDPDCGIDDYNPITGMCEDVFGPTGPPTCPQGWVWNATTKMCERE